MQTALLDYDDIFRAHQRIEPFIHRTPVMTSDRLNRICGAELHFKCENLQRTGSFKLRGATNAIRMLVEAGHTGPVVTHSSGNHGAALSAAATRAGLEAHIVVPEGAVASKLKAIEAYGGIIHRCEATQQAREAGLAELVSRLDAHPVPPYDDVRIIAGQGTVALELMQQVDGLECLIAPVGGGGLISGTAVAAASRVPAIKTYGAEPEQANDSYRSLQQGSRVNDHHPDTIADGLRAMVGVSNFQIMQELELEILCVSEQDIIDSLKLFWHTTKLIIEPSCAVVLAAIRNNQPRFAGLRVGVILSGGNIDLDNLPW